jgi:ATP-dependent helicase/nuclease subunit B
MDVQAEKFLVHPTGYGPPATRLLHQQVRTAKGGDPLAPITVIVPSNYAAVSTRRALAGRPGGVANVTFLTLFRLAERLGAASLAAAGRRPVSTPVLAQAVRAILASEPGVFAPVAGHPATELALVAATQELAGLSDSALDAVAACSARAENVVRVARQMWTALRPAWYDEHDLVRAATAAVSEDATVGPVIVHLLQDLSPAAAELLRTLARHHAVLVNVGITGDASADQHVLDAHARAGITVDNGAPPQPMASAIVSVSDPDEEVRTAVRQVTEWAREGVRLGRMALLYGTAEPYVRLLHEHLEAAGVPHNGAPVRDIGDMLYGRTVRSLLVLSDRGFRRSDVLAVVTGAPIRKGDGLAPGRAWERISRIARVVGGGDWASRLAVFAEDQRVRAVEADNDEQDRLAEHLRRDAGRAEDLAGFVSDLQNHLSALDATGSWAALVDATHALMSRYLGEERHRWRWPREEQEAADRVEEVLDRLAGLDAVEGPTPSTEVFRRTLDGELERSMHRVGHLGDGVLVGPVSMATGLDLDRLIVLGMAEGAYPPRRLEDSLLPDDERRAADGELALRVERANDDHRQLLAAMAAADHTTLSFPRGDLRRQGDRPASRWLLSDAAHLSGRDSLFTRDLQSLKVDWLREVPSYAAGLAQLHFPATAQELRLSAMLRDPAPVIATDLVLGAGVDLARSRRSNEFTRFDGNLAGLDLPDLTSTGLTSATRMESWAVCPHAFLMQYLLDVEVVEDPERKLEINPLDKGSLIHEILERFVTEQIAAGRSGPWSGAEHERLLEIAEEIFVRYAERGVTGRSMFWRRDRARILADLDRFATLDDGRPLATELQFDSVAYPLPDGRSVRFRGSIDRVDDAGPGWARVIDYKTGSTRQYSGLSVEDPHQRGTHLQLAVYATAVQQLLERPHVQSRYWFVTDKGNFEGIGYPVTPDIQAAVGQALGDIVDGIRSGIFPSRPPVDPAYLWVDCWYCAPDGLSTAEARRDWERKRSDLRLARYLQLAEPEAADASP